ncbi:MAG: hypothetical protein Q8907_11790 [Bacteroidota bacterium]|nr:hypothetical protein [Bacteroidota bacterium]
MRNQFVLIVLLILSYIPCYAQNSIISDSKIQDIIKSTHILRTSYQDTAVINLYQGNGKFGCSYGPLGLHVNPSKTAALCKYGKTQYMHLEHSIRAKFGADYLIPLFRIYWKEEPSKINHYRQYQSFYDGTIVTHFEYNKNKVTVTTWFDPVEKDIAGIKINLEGNAPDIILEPFEKMKLHYDQDIIQVAKISTSTDLSKIELTCQGTKTVAYIKTNSGLQVQGSKLCLKLHPGENKILISVNHLVGSDSDKSLKQTIAWWQSKWKHTGIIVLPDPDAQKMWVRSMALFLSTYNGNKFGISPPMGFTGNGWPFPFPQDVSYIHPVLLATGNFDIAKSWIEYWAEKLSGMKEYTKRLLNVEGVLCPWVFPYHDFVGYHDPVPPNECYYEIHNSGYLARMAYETAILVNDRKWTQKYVLPLIKETAQFYKNICFKGADGFWHLSVKPSMGQDEMGGYNQDDYLCALFSAKYCFQKALACNLDTDGSYNAILKDGLAFPSLKSSEGYYFTCRGSGEKDFGKQKHPVQLNDLTYLPVNSKIENPSSIAYHLRYEITQDANKPFFNGWTLGEFLLAGSRIGDVKEWEKDWENLRKSDYIDADWIQVYETSRAHGSSFYSITNGLIAQSLLNNIVSDWFGKLEIAKCNPWKGKVFIKNIYSLLGVEISGEINYDAATIYLTAWKNCEFSLFEKKIKMNKDEKIKIALNLKTKQIVDKRDF